MRCSGRVPLGADVAVAVGLGEDDGEDPPNICSISCVVQPPAVSVPTVTKESAAAFNQLENLAIFTLPVRFIAPSLTLSLNCIDP